MKEYQEKLAHYFLDGDEDAALEYIKTLLNKYPRLYLFEDVITPAMYYIGELWEKNKISVADEHLATAICDFVLSKLEADSDGIKGHKQKKFKAILFGVEQEQHYIGLKMVADTFKDNGWRVRYLGPNLPLAHSLVQIEKYKPEVIGLSAALSYRLPTLKILIERFKDLHWKPLIMVGGRMAKKFDLKEFESDQVMVVKDLNHLHQWFKEGREGVINETS
ncbi:B12-binding domain-containing protein [Halobacillus sp. BBL2006]|uniref:cobalamin B12-binding domain-containing protein n=1 Tax=Halobacillus sp. BBL2006 TaxID=1543706 RepID=UPI0005432F75|nr:B12-binding domain-containing protein [Halobacillus sp. BBL2006]KHE73098.1 cobalamin-binding domain protein [Halobacillus sp. BBL2006]